MSLKQRAMISIESKTTDNHEIIKKWVEERYGEPAMVEGVVDKEKAGEMLRIQFSDNADESLKDISWKLFYKIFDENNLAFLYQEKIIDGAQNKFFEFIKKENQ